jgi:hypothetical protein
MSSTKLGMTDSIVDGEDNDQGGIIEAIPKDKAEDLLEIIRSGMQDGGGGNQHLQKNKKPSPNYLNQKSVLYPSISQFQLRMN